MGTFRFNRRIKTGPNTYMNIGKNGVSTSFRAGGMTFTSGKNGSYVTTGIPGTGMSYRQKIGGGSSNGQRPKKGNQYSGGAFLALIGMGVLFALPTFINSSMMITILLSIFGACMIIAAVIILWSKCVTIPKARRELGDALEAEEATVLEEIAQTVQSLKSKLDSENNPLKKKAYEAIVTNYPYVRLYNYYTSRKTEFEQRPDFKQSFVQEFYEANNEAISNLGSPTIVDIDGDIDNITRLKYNFVGTAFNALGISNSLEMNGCELNGQVFKPSCAQFFYLSVGKNEIPNLRCKEGNYFIYPTFILKYDGGDKITFYSMDSVSAKTELSEMRTAANRAPLGANVIKTTWVHMTKNGQPDARYSNNPKYVTYQGVNIFIAPCRNLKLFEASIGAATSFAKAINILSGYISPSAIETKEILKSLDEKRNKFNQKLVQHLTSEPQLPEILKYVCSQETVSTSDLQRKFACGFNRAGKYMDLLEDLTIVGPANGASPREVLWDAESLTHVLSQIEVEAKTSSSVNEKPVKPEPTSKRGKPTTTLNSEVKSHQKELETLIGLESVKQEVNDLSSFIKIQQMRQSKGLKASPISYHCVFTGNPGTGKTTVARIIADIYKELGVLSKGHLVETDRSGLVAEYVGQTAVKTNKVIDSALDGVLFIDEAYSLAPASSNDFGHEAIATLLKRMEDNRDWLIVILAGYGDEMQTFIDANPGLQSRFNRYIHFPDYSADELVEIFLSNLKKNEYVLADDALNTLKKEINDAVSKKDKNFGNARTIRNIFERTLQNQARRISKSGDLSTESLQTITKEDIPDL